MVAALRFPQSRSRKIHRIKRLEEEKRCRMNLSQGGSALPFPLEPGGGGDQVTAPAVPPKLSWSTEVREPPRQQEINNNIGDKKPSPTRNKEGQQ